MLKTGFRDERKRKDRRFVEGLGETLRNLEVRGAGGK